MQISQFKIAVGLTPVDVKYCQKMIQRVRNNNIDVNNNFLFDTDIIISEKNFFNFRNFMNNCQLCTFEEDEIMKLLIKLDSIKDTINRLVLVA